VNIHFDNNTQLINQKKKEFSYKERKTKNKLTFRKEKIFLTLSMDACEIANFLASELFMHQVNIFNYALIIVVSVY
jgi:hypothetical protein